MRITEITPLDKRKSKVLTDEGFALAFYKGELQKYQIETGAEISPERWSELLEGVFCPRAREKALYLLQSRDRTEREIRRKLAEGYYPEEAIERTVEFLKEYGYINDPEYGRRYVELYGGRRSRTRILSDLIRKGLTREQAEEILDAGDVAEERQIEAFLRRRHFDAKETPAGERRKLFAALLRKGYSPDAVRHVMGGESVWEDG